MDLLIQQLAQELSLNPTHVEAVVKLLDEGNTIPFIARYRKEAHGSMSDDVLRDLADRSITCATCPPGGRRSARPSRPRASSPPPSAPS